MTATLIEEAKSQNAVAPAKIARRWPGITTAAVVSLVCFAAINMLLWLRFGDGRVSRDMWGGSGSIDLAIKKYAKLTTRPQVVLLGSSLMMFPFWAMDKELNPNIADIFRHRESVTLEKALSTPTKSPSVYSFAIFGQMVSDAYLYVDEFLKDGKAPDYLVFGVAPRDFHDFDLPAPMSTYSFKRLVNIDNFYRYAAMYMPEFQDQADFLFGHTCYFYGKRWYIQREFAKALKRTAALTGIASDTSSTQTNHGKAGFMLFGGEKERWQGSLEEYKRRYTNIDEGKDIALHMGFLKRVLAVCQQRNIKVIVVNMPLTDVNRNLLPPGFLTDFDRKIAGICQSSNARYIDLSASPEFTHGDFWDTTHLNQFGGHKLLKHILPWIGKSS